MQNLIITALAASIAAFLCYGAWRLWEGRRLRRLRAQGVVAVGRPLDLMLAIAKWALFAAVLASCCVVFMYAGAGMWFATLIIAGMIAARRRTMRRSMLLATMASTAEQGQSLVESVEAYGKEVHGLLGGDMRRLALHLDYGDALPDAIINSGNPLNPSATELICANADDGNLAGVLADTLAAEELLEPSLARAWGKILYFGAVFGFVTAILTFLMISIIPKFVKIFADFGVEMPTVTKLLIFISSALSSALPVGPLLFLLLALFLLDVSLHFIGITPQSIFGRWLLRGLQRATMLRALAYAVGRSRPLLPVLESLTSFCAAKRMRRRLSRAIDRIERGEQWPDALRDERLVTSAQAALFHSAQRVGNVSWALRESAESAARRMVYRLDRVTEALFPMVVLAVSLLVMFICVALFFPMIQLIISLS